MPNILHNSNDKSIITGSGLFSVIDLTFGSIRPHEAAHQLAAQLSVDLPKTVAEPRAGLQSGFKFIDSAEEGVDNEARGEKSRLDAWKFAQELSRIIDGPLYVIYPRFQLECDIAEIEFLKFLTELLPAGSVQEVREEEFSDFTPIKSTISCDDKRLFAPGVLCNEDLSAAGWTQDDLFSLPGGNWLVPPVHRRDPAELTRSDWDWFSIIAARLPWISAWAHLHASPMMTQIEQMVRLTEICYEAGYVRLALQYAKHISCVAKTPRERALWTVRLQGMRIGKLHFLDAAAQKIPENFPNDMLGFLKLTVGWGHIMTGQFGVADELFGQARSLMSDLQDRPEYLYVLNISALARARLGHLDEAEKMELEIERRLAEISPKLRSMEYINAINLHRLYRIKQDIPQARKYLMLAQNANAGTRTHNDAVYLAHNFFRMSQMEGDTKEALGHLLACALLFVADVVPEATASRTAAGLLAKPWPLKKEWSVNELATALCQKLQECAVEAGLYLSNDLEVVPTFALPSQIVGNPELQAIDLGKVGVLSTEIEHKPLRQFGAAHAQLCFMITRVMAALNGGFWIWPTVVVDDRHGRGLPRSADELIASALSHGVSRLHKGRQTTEISTQTSKRLVAKLAPGVETIKDGFVVFRRILPQQALSVDDYHLAKSLSEHPNGKNFAKFSKPDKQALRRLEHNLIAVIDLPTGQGTHEQV